MTTRYDRYASWPISTILEPKTRLPDGGQSFSASSNQDFPVPSPEKTLSLWLHLRDIWFFDPPDGIHGARTHAYSSRRRQFQGLESPNFLALSMGKIRRAQRNRHLRKSGNGCSFGDVRMGFIHQITSSRRQCGRHFGSQMASSLLRPSQNDLHPSRRSRSSRYTHW